MTDDELLARIHGLVTSVWGLESLLLLRKAAPAALGQADLVRELRSSDVAVENALAALRVAGFVAADPDGRTRYEPASRELDAIAGRIEALYAAKPLAVAKAIMSAPSNKLRIFSDAFRLKD